MNGDRELRGWNVIVPRGGKWGDQVAANLRAFGASPVIAPLINFAATEHPEQLDVALAELRLGRYDWIVITSTPTIDVLVSHEVRVPNSTRIAAVGNVTAAALRAAGYTVNFIPRKDNSARGLVKEWPHSDIRGRVLIPQSDLAEPTLVAGLEELGFAVEFVSAYRTIGVPVTPAVKQEAAAGNIHAVLVTSGSVARQVAEQLAPLPERTVVACIGPRTAFDARAVGLRVDVIAEERSADSLIDALVEFARERA